MNNESPESTDHLWKRDEIESPCIKLCTIHPVDKVCAGCYRSLSEIGRWSQMSAEERARIMAQLPMRGAVPKKRREGRKTGLKRG